MTWARFAEDSVIFSLDVPEAVNELLQAAVAASRNDKAKAEQLFMQAYRLDTGCLQTYFALYKFYFYQARLFEAEKFVLAALDEAAKQGGFPNDYEVLFRDRQWDMYADDKSMFYLYSLKALAFIKLRQGQATQARAILTALEALDAEDRSGASVIMDMAAALEEETD